MARTKQAAGESTDGKAPSCGSCLQGRLRTSSRTGDPCLLPSPHVVRFGDLTNGSYQASSARNSAGGKAPRRALIPAACL